MVNGWSKIAQSLWPGLCFVCGAASGRGLDLCGVCEASLPWFDASHACPRCAEPLELASLCGRCLRHPPPFERVRATLHYGEPVDRLVQGLKFEGRLACARLLATLLARSLAPVAPVDLLVPVPLADRRLRERGFDQAVEVGRLVARALSLPFEPRGCRRLRHTSAQVGQGAEARARNLRGAFRAGREWVAGRRIALLDDVMTTGATARAVAGALLEAGAREVEVWVCARAGRDSA